MADKKKMSWVTIKACESCIHSTYPHVHGYYRTMEQVIVGEPEAEQ